VALLTHGATLVAGRVGGQPRRDAVVLDDDSGSAMLDLHRVPARTVGVLDVAILVVGVAAVDAVRPRGGDRDALAVRLALLPSHAS
jgi:hypothetical protein